LILRWSIYGFAVAGNWLIRSTTSGMKMKKRKTHRVLIPCSLILRWSIYGFAVAGNWLIRSTTSGMKMKKRKTHRVLCSNLCQAIVRSQRKFHSGRVR
jgi:hypothetical protein